MSSNNIARTTVAALLLVFYATTSRGEDTPMWLTSACYKFKLSVWDKFYTGSYEAKYIVKSDGGRMFIAEKHIAAGNNPDTGEVSFPDDFRDAHNLKAGIDCVGAKSYTWEIYSNGVLRDSGSIAFASANEQKMRNTQR